MIEDEKIIEMFFERSEQGIRELDIKYGKVCHKLSYNIVNSRQDAEECVNDAYLGAWNAIPPANPHPLLTYICKIVRNISLKIYYRKEAAKRNSTYTIAMEEIEACIADPNTVEAEIEARELARIIESFLDTLTVENPVEDKLCFGIGYHPAFALPFDDRHVTEDYEIRFDGVESPLCVSAQPNGLLNGQSYYLARNVEAIQLTDDLFDNDSHAMVNLRSAHVSVIEKDTGRSVICDVSDFPYTLIWSAPKKPLHFICIEPWHSLPGEENGPIDWEQRPCAAILKKGESWSTTLSTTFVR